MGPLRLVTDTFGFKFALLVFTMAYMSTTVGMSAATGVDGHAEVRENMTGAVDRALANATETENASAASAPLIDGIGVTVKTVVGSSWDFGYHHPDLAHWYVNLSPYALAVGLWLYFKGRPREGYVQ